MTSIATLFVTVLVSFQSQNNIRLNGIVEENEWKNATEYKINDNSKVLLIQEKEALYVALVSTKKIWSHVYLSDAQTVNVMHASAALDAVAYKKEQSGWQTGDTFGWELRDRVYNDEVKAKMDSYYNTNGWVANNGSMADGKTIEFKINITKKGPLFLACVMADYDVNLSYFPTTLSDDTILKELVQGNTLGPLKFEPSTWLKIKD